MRTSLFRNWHLTILLSLVLTQSCKSFVGTSLLRRSSRRLSVALDRFLQMGVQTRRKRQSYHESPAPLPVTSMTSASEENPIPVTPSPTKKRPRPAAPSKTEAQRELILPLSEGLTSELIASINPKQPYVDLKVPPAELRPSATLTTGQCFHWRALVSAKPSQDETKKSAWGSHDATEWVGTIRFKGGVSVVVAIQETPTTTLFRPLTTQKSDVELATALREYFRLEDSLEDLYQSWSAADPRLAAIAECIPGVRILEQDPFECLISFICSSNNNIPRITKMVNAIRANYGEPLLEIGEETFYSFPSLETLAKHGNDADFRSVCGLGYRSKYILETLQLLQEKGGEEYLANLRNIQDPLEVQEKLCDFCGVGRKVADCVSLFSLRQDDAIPVDVHVWNIARRDYDPDNALDQIKSLTPTAYRQVGDLFRSRFSQKAGWAHSLLFVAELPSFRPILPERLVAEMEEFQKEEKLKKQQAADAKKKAKAGKAKKLSNK